MRTYQHTFFTALDGYDILHFVHQSDAGVCSGLRRRFLYWYLFRFSTMLWSVCEITLRHSVVISAVPTVLPLILRNFHVNYKNFPCVLSYPRLSLGMFVFNFLSWGLLITLWKQLLWLFHFLLYSSAFICLSPLRGSQDTAIIVLDTYDMYTWGSDAGVGSGRLVLLFYSYGFRFSVLTWNVFEIGGRNSDVY